MSVEKHGATVPVSSELLYDYASFPSINAVIAESYDRMVNPWRYPDRNPVPTLVLLPRLHRVGEAQREARRRVSGAWDVLRYGVTDDPDS